MVRNTDFRKLAFIGDYLPRKCGIATFTADSAQAIASQYPSPTASSCRSTTLPRATTIRRKVRFEFEEQDLDSYRRAADFLNFSNIDVVSLQHEYGIYGGPAGRHILGVAARPAHAGGHHAAHHAERTQRTSSAA